MISAPRCFSASVFALTSSGGSRGGGDAAKACQFLSKLAEGADAPKGGEWPVNSEEHLFATQLRFKLVATLGLEQGNALLRAMARDGRLHPGLAPPLGKAVVGTEEHAFSSKEQLRSWVRSGGDQATRRATLL